jgi:FKBP-type peptidyl-prolyl cis-trans isomerase 2
LEIVSGDNCRKKVEGDKVTIDTNHPLAGIALNFDIKVVSVREAQMKNSTMAMRTKFVPI